MDEGPRGRPLSWLDRDTLERLCRQGRELLKRARTRAAPGGSRGGEVEGEPMNLNTAFATMAEYMDYVSNQCGRFHVLDNVALNHVCRYHQKQQNSGSSPQVRQKKSASYDPRERYQESTTDQGQVKIGTRPYRVDPGPSESGLRSSRIDPGPSESGLRSSRNDPGPSESGLRSSRIDPGPSKSVDRTSSKDITIEVCPGTYSVTVESPTVSTTRMIEVDSGQIIDLSFPL